MKKPLALLSCLVSLISGFAVSAPDTPPAVATERVLTVCADPNNMPFSNKAQEGFENKIVSRIAVDMHATINYVWGAQRRGYARNTLNEAQCDLWPGVASGIERMATTAPYYRSTYVFVTRADRPLSGLTLSDPRLRTLKVGVQMIGNDGTNTPPAHALASRGITGNVRGYMLYGNYESQNPPAAIIDAVTKGDVDIAVVWGPLAGYFSKAAATPLRLENVTPAIDNAIWPMTYDICVGLRRQNIPLRTEIEAILAREAPWIDALLRGYGVPVLPRVFPPASATKLGTQASRPEL